MNFFSTKHILRGFIVLAAVLLLSACDAVPTTVNNDLNNQNTEYSGPACLANAGDPDDACSFQRYFWAPMIANYGCENCHDSSAPESLQFLHEGNVNTAYNAAKKSALVNLDSPEVSKIIDTIRPGHKGSCDPASTCGAMADNIIIFIKDWSNGGTNTGGGNGGSNALVLEAPEQRNAGTSKTLPNPPDLGDFASLHQLLKTHCATCHVSSPPVSVPQSPYFAENDAADAYAALLSNPQVINLDNPANSSLVRRLTEGHNCWDLSAADEVTDKYACATEMRMAIEGFARTIDLPSEVDTNWVISKALGLKDGLVASGDAPRNESGIIALYQFRAGVGNVISDTSGVTPALDLSLAGDEGSDFKWVGGWGVEFLGGYAHSDPDNTRKLRDRIVASGEYAIEAWVVPGNVSQGTAGDPARIISYSASEDSRNFTFGQAEYRYEYMHRSSSTNANGEPSLITDADAEDAQAVQQHVVITYSRNNGRRIYVNGVDTGDSIDTSSLTDTLADWDSSYPLVFGSEAGGSQPWQGKLRLVAIYDTAMSEAQIQQNFEAGVGEKFLLLFNVSEHLFTSPPAPDKGTYVMFTVSQYDDYSYLFYKPTLVSLDPDFQPGSIIVKNLRLGLNGREPAVGQAFRNINTTVTSNIFTNGQVLSELGTIIALEKGPDADEFFLTFEQLGNSEPDVRDDMICGLNASCPTPSSDNTQVSDIGLRTFDEINASMAAITGVDMHASGNESVKSTYLTIKQQLPSQEDIGGFLPAHQMAIVQLAMQYCDALVEDPALRDSFYGSFGFDQDVSGAYGNGYSTQKQQMLNALYDNIIGLPDANDSNNILSGVPTRAELEAELFTAPPVTDSNGTTYPGNLFDRLAASGTDATRTRTQTIAKALCAATLGSAAMLIQ
ncbi:MAG: LamG domain-containing protein [Gammaproteobacteria bacterium]|nr:LamG domain-containing protein [Gammaproteobacteria bacterium]MCF6364488.1 LamG domain-containing protein [Gammaproteobacteria bacterium]